MIFSVSESVQDTLVASKINSGGESDWIMHHVLDSHEFDFAPFGSIPLPHISLLGLDISITKHVVFLWIVAVLLIVAFKIAANAYKKSLVPHGFTNFMEVMIIFVRDDIAKPTIGKGYEKFLPYLLTVFFFILFSNFFGLVPNGSTITSNISVTATLAIIAFIVIQGGGMMQNGVFGYFRGLIPGGVPTWLLPIMFIVEILGLFTKPFALAVRLFANMTAGHIIIFSLIGLIFILKTYYVAPVSIAFALFIYLLEILVALIQAYIFTMLTALFIGMAVHQEH
ncbi:ATP synthase F0 sector subunit a [hydrothermal vent metagenome]|uniref:ATP synthase F0 sector subunit a n=1 Tax=hydrothermal vent metagenome TaxID=652676 RepID=A0A3B1C467_9ZZZZ